jgi:hypothetical protein
MGDRSYSTWIFQVINFEEGLRKFIHFSWGKGGILVILVVRLKPDIYRVFKKRVTGFKGVECSVK